MEMPTRECEPYPSNLTDAEWKVLEPLLPGPAKLGRPPRYEKRAILNAIFDVVRSGCSWRMLPGEMPPWRIVYYYFMRWRQEGRWLLMHDALRDALRQWSGRKKAPRAAVLDAQSVQCAHHRGSRGYEAGKKVLGRKRHLVVDTLGLILGGLVTPANVSDPAGAAELLPEVVGRFGRVRHLWADRTYSGLKIMDQLQEWFPRRGLRLEIVRAKEGSRGFAAQPHRWIIERTFAWLTQNRRLVKDYVRAGGQQRGHDPHRHVKTHAQTTGKMALLDRLSGDWSPALASFAKILVGDNGLWPSLTVDEPTQVAQWEKVSHPIIVERTHFALNYPPTREDKISSSRHQNGVPVWSSTFSVSTQLNLVVPLLLAHGTLQVGIGQPKQ